MIVWTNTSQSSYMILNQWLIHSTIDFHRPKHRQVELNYADKIVIICSSCDISWTITNGLKCEQTKSNMSAEAVSRFLQLGVSCQFWFFGSFVNSSVYILNLNRKLVLDSLDLNCQNHSGFQSRNFTFRATAQSSLITIIKRLLRGLHWFISPYI